MGDRSVPLVVAKVVELMETLGVSGINRLPGAWIYRVDNHWTIAASGHRQPVKVEPEGCVTIDLDPFTFAAWWNGWLAMVLDLREGWIAAGELANEETLIEALDAAIVEAKEG